MSISERAARAPRHKKTGPIPIMTQLMSALDDEDREALMGLLVDKSYSANIIFSVLQEEKAAILERAKNAKGDEKKRLEHLAKIHQVSAYNIGHFRRQLRGGKGVI